MIDIEYDKLLQNKKEEEQDEKDHKIIINNDRDINNYDYFEDIEDIEVIQDIKEIEFDNEQESEASLLKTTSVSLLKKTIEFKAVPIIISESDISEAESTTSSASTLKQQQQINNNTPTLTRNKSKLEITQGYCDNVLEISIEGAPKPVPHPDDHYHRLFNLPFHQEEIQVSEYEKPIHTESEYYDDDEDDDADSHINSPTHNLKQPPHRDIRTNSHHYAHQKQKSRDLMNTSYSDEDSDSSTDNERPKQIQLNKGHHKIKHKKPISNINSNVKVNTSSNISSSYNSSDLTTSFKKTLQEKVNYFIDDDGYSLDDFRSCDCVTPYYRLLKDNGCYMLLWLAGMVSLMGDWFNELACLTLLTRYNASGLMISAFLVLRESPPIVLQALTGIVSDSFDRRFIMMATDLIRACIVLLFLFVQSEYKLWLLYILAIFQFSVGSFFQPAKQALLPSIVKPNEIIIANAVDQSTYSMMMLLGAALGGIISYYLGTNLNFIIDSATYLISALLVYFLYNKTKSILEINPKYKLNNTNNQSLLNQQEQQQKDEESQLESNNNIILTTLPSNEDNLQKEESKVPTQSPNRIKDYFEMYRKGFEFLSKNKYIFIITFVKASGAIVWAGIDTIHIRIAETNFKIGHDSSLSLGIILASGGLGITFVPFIFSRIVKDLPKNHNNILKFGFFLNAFNTISLGFSSENFPLYLLFNTLRSSSTCILWLYSSSILAQLVPNHIRGRVFSFEYGILTVFAISAKLMTGIFLDYFSYAPREIIFIFGTLGIFIFFFWLIAFDKYLREPVKE